MFIMRSNVYIVKVKFLMNMFNGMVINPLDGSVNPNGVKQFKQVLTNMRMAGQIEHEMELLVESIFGIVNTDTFKPSVQMPKVQNIVDGMKYIEQSSQSSTDGQIIKNLKNMAETHLISQTVADILIETYFGDNHNNSNTVAPGIVIPGYGEGIRSTGDKIELGKQNAPDGIKDGKHIPTVLKTRTGKTIEIPSVAKQFRGAGFKDRRSLEGLNSKEVKEVTKLYRDLYRAYVPMGSNVLCPFFKDIACIEYKDVNPDPCSGGFTTSRLPISEPIMERYDGRVVYATDNSDACGPTLYLPLEKYLTHYINILVDVHGLLRKREGL